MNIQGTWLNSRWMYEQSYMHITSKGTQANSAILSSNLADVFDKYFVIQSRRCLKLVKLFMHSPNEAMSQTRLLGPKWYVLQNVQE